MMKWFRRRKRRQQVEKLQPLLDVARTHSEIKVLLHLIVDANPVMRIAYMRELGEAFSRLGVEQSVCEAAIYAVEDWGLTVLAERLPPLEAADVPTFEEDDAST
jgi:hypothetical protein